LIFGTNSVDTFSFKAKVSISPERAKQRPRDAVLRVRLVAKRRSGQLIVASILPNASCEMVSIVVPFACAERAGERPHATVCTYRNMLTQLILRAGCFLKATFIARFGAGKGTRTLTMSPPADFESAASTNSAIPARDELSMKLRTISKDAV
jgi:hypothetical protein